MIRFDLNTGLPVYKLGHHNIVVCFHYIFGLIGELCSKWQQKRKQKNMKIIISFGFYLISLTCICQALMNGKLAQNGQFRYQVAIDDSSNNNHLCSGAVLTKFWIATAAQCTQGVHALPENIRIFVGSITLNGTDGKAFEVEKIVNHPEFNWTSRLNDISLIRTKKHMEIHHHNVFPVKFPSFVEDYKMENGLEHYEFTVSSWGPNNVSKRMSFFFFHLNGFNWLYL